MPDTRHPRPEAQRPKTETRRFATAAEMRIALMQVRKGTGGASGQDAKVPPPFLPPHFHHFTLNFEQQSGGLVFRLVAERSAEENFRANKKTRPTLCS